MSKVTTSPSTFTFCMAIGPYHAVVTLPVVRPPRVVISSIITPGKGGALSKTHAPSTNSFCSDALATSAPAINTVESIALGMTESELHRHAEVHQATHGVINTRIGIAVAERGEQAGGDHRRIPVEHVVDAGTE